MAPSLRSICMTTASLITTVVVSPHPTGQNRNERCASPPNISLSFRDRDSRVQDKFLGRVPRVAKRACDFNRNHGDTCGSPADVCSLFVLGCQGHRCVLAQLGASQYAPTYATER